jgi:hypothetical protein
VSILRHFPTLISDGKTRPVGGTESQKTCLDIVDASRADWGLPPDHVDKKGNPRIDGVSVRGFFCPTGETDEE